MRVVIDTNVVVSAAFRDRHPERVILFVVGHPEFEWVASAEIVEEYVEVLQRDKFHLPEAILQKWESDYDARGRQRSEEIKQIRGTAVAKPDHPNLPRTSPKPALKEQGNSRKR